jgi:5-methylcytosine-specific restriction protein A
VPSRPPIHGSQPRPRQTKHYEQVRGTATQRGYDSRWRKARLGWLAKHPLCVHCQAEGRVTAANVVDHIIPHRGDTNLFWDSKGNWQSLCTSHHAVKTAQEDGGFGNVPRLPSTRKSGDD